MFAYDKTFDLKVVIGQYDLISRFSDFALNLGTQLVYEHIVFTKTFDREVLRGQCDLIHGSVILPYISTLS